MKLRFIAMLISLLAAQYVFGQFIPLDSLKRETYVPASIIKFSPFHVVNFYPTIEISYEFKLKGRFTMQAEGGYVLNYDGAGDTDFMNKRGFKAKLEERFYLVYFDRHPGNFYLAAETYYNYVNFDRQEEVRDCFDNNCQFPFTRKSTFLMRYREYGESVKWGWIKYWSRFVLDLNAGWTVRVVRYERAIPQSGLNSNDFVLDLGVDTPNERDRTTIGPNLGIRIGYRFK